MARRVHGLITTSRISVVRGSGAYPAAAAQPAVAAVLWSCFSVLIFRSLGGSADYVEGLAHRAALLDLHRVNPIVGFWLDVGNDPDGA